MELQDPNSNSKEEPENELGCPIGSYIFDFIKCGSILYSVLTASVMSLLVGATMTFPSAALLELIQLPDPAFRLDTLWVDRFGGRRLRWGREEAFRALDVAFKFCLNCGSKYT